MVLKCTLTFTFQFKSKPCASSLHQKAYKGNTSSQYQNPRRTCQSYPWGPGSLIPWDNCSQLVKPAIAWALSCLFLTAEAQLDLTTVHVWSVVDKVTMGQVSLRELRFALSVIIPACSTFIHILSVQLAYNWLKYWAAQSHLTPIIRRISWYCMTWLISLKLKVSSPMRKEQPTGQENGPHSYWENSSKDQGPNNLLEDIWSTAHHFNVWVIYQCLLITSRWLPSTYCWHTARL